MFNINRFTQSISESKSNEQSDEETIKKNNNRYLDKLMTLSK